MYEKNTVIKCNNQIFDQFNNLFHGQSQIQLEGTKIGVKIIYHTDSYKTLNTGKTYMMNLIAFNILEVFKFKMLSGLDWWEIFFLREYQFRQNFNIKRLCKNNSVSPFKKKIINGKICSKSFKMKQFDCK